MQRAYKENWEHDKEIVYYPYHITSEYEVIANNQLLQVSNSTNYKIISISFLF